VFYIVGRSFLKREAVQRQGIQFGNCHVYMFYFTLKQNVGGKVN